MGDAAIDKREFIEACQAGLTGIVKLCLKTGAFGEHNLQSDSFYLRGLHAACAEGHYDVVAAVLSFCEDLDPMIISDYCTRLLPVVCTSADHNIPGLVSLMIDYDARIDEPNFNGDTPLSILSNRLKWIEHHEHLLSKRMQFADAIKILTAAGAANRDCKTK